MTYTDPNGLIIDEYMCPVCSGPKPNAKAKQCWTCAWKRPEIRQPQDASIRHIPLTKGMVAIIDASDFEWASLWNWSATSKGRKHIRFYASHAYNGRTFYLHRELMGNPVGLLVDHINRNTLDNRRSNLRLATHLENMHNLGIHSNNTSGVRGVSWVAWLGKWHAYIHRDGKRVNLGWFVDKQEALDARINAAREMYGEFSGIHTL